jgi:hypothetical protein
MKSKNRTKTLTHTARPPSAIVWNQPDFEREVKKAQKIGPKEMSDAELLNFCRGAHGFFYAHFWSDARPFFVELWRRIEEQKMPEIENSKTEACKRIGCSIRWAQMIVRGTAKDSNAGKANEKESRREVCSRQAPLTKDEYVFAILKFGFETIKPLRRDSWELYRDICAELAKQFSEASKTPDADESRSPSAEGKSTKNKQIMNGDERV